MFISIHSRKHSGLCIRCRSKGQSHALKHGEIKTRLYGIWCGLKQRRYKTYKPKVCEEWKSFVNFRDWALSHGYTDELTIDRIDPRGDYEPSNCRWITLEENSRRANEIFSYEQKVEIYNERKRLGITLVEMAKRLGVHWHTVQRAEKEVREHDI